MAVTGVITMVVTVTVTVAVTEHTHGSLCGLRKHAERDSFQSCKAFYRDADSKRSLLFADDACRIILCQFVLPYLFYLQRQIF